MATGAFVCARPVYLAAGRLAGLYVTFLSHDRSEVGNRINTNRSMDISKELATANGRFFVYFYHQPRK